MQDMYGVGFDGEQYAIKMRFPSVEELTRYGTDRRVSYGRLSRRRILVGYLERHLQNPAFPIRGRWLRLHRGHRPESCRAGEQILPTRLGARVLEVSSS